MAFIAFPPRIAMPGRRPRRPYLRGTWTLARPTASSEAPTARHSRAIMRVDLAADAKFHRVTTPHPSTTAPRPPMSLAGGRWARGEGTLGLPRGLCGHPIPGRRSVAVRPEPSAARDPVFRVNQKILNSNIQQLTDLEGSGDICICCHNSNAWTSGRTDLYLTHEGNWPQWWRNSDGPARLCGPTRVNAGGCRTGRLVGAPALDCEVWHLQR
jgi:hypothetical protein